jgi:hypothetical protein
LFRYYVLSMGIPVKRHAINITSIVKNSMQAIVASFSIIARARCAWCGSGDVRWTITVSFIPFSFPLRLHAPRKRDMLGKMLGPSGPNKNCRSEVRSITTHCGRLEVIFILSLANSEECEHCKYAAEKAQSPSHGPNNFQRFGRQAHSLG